MRSLSGLDSPEENSTTLDRIDATCIIAWYQQETCTACWLKSVVPMSELGTFVTSLRRIPNGKRVGMVDLEANALFDVERNRECGM